MNWLPAVAVLGGLITVHELGHFFAARACGVEVEEFSLGFGPRLLGFHAGGTLYALRLLPVLGYVRMAGMYPAEGDGSSEAQRSRAANARGVGFASRPLGQRFFIIAAGPLVNFLVAFLLFATALGAIGLPVSPTLRIHTVESGMPAAAAGLRPGDTVLAVDGAAVHSWNGLHQAIVTAAGPNGRTPISVTVRRDGQTAVVHVTPEETSSGPLIGIVPVMLTQRLGFFAAIGQGAAGTVSAIYQTLAGLVGMLAALIQHKPAPGQIMGPIGIGNTIDQASQAGASTLMLFAGLLSANLGLLNLLPVPALDGGRLGFLSAEWLRGGRPVDPAKEGLVHFIGLAVLMAFIVLISVHDIAHLG